MAQTGFTPIQLYFSSTTTNVPLAANLANGELAINITDGKLFYKDNAAAVQVIGWKVTPTSAGGTGLTSYTAGDLPYYASGTAFTKLGIGSADYVMTSSGSAPEWSASLKAKAGGTGQTSFAVGDLLYADTTTTLAKLADVATGNALISGGVSTAPSWGKIGLTTHVSGILPVANGGTGLSALGPAFSAYQSSAQTGFSSAILYKLTFTTEEFDTNNNFASSTFTPTVAGYYQVSGAFATSLLSSLPTALAIIYKNGSLYKNSGGGTGGASSFVSTSVSALVYMNGTTDYLELYAYVDLNGLPGTYDTRTGQNSTYFQAVFVRGA